MGKWYKAGIATPTPNVHLYIPLSDDETELVESMGTLRAMADDSPRIARGILRTSNFLTGYDIGFKDYYRFGSDC